MITVKLWAVDNLGLDTLPKWYYCGIALVLIKTGLGGPYTMAQQPLTAEANAYRVALELIDEELEHTGLGHTREQELKEAYTVLAALSAALSAVSDAHAKGGCEWATANMHGQTGIPLKGQLVTGQLIFCKTHGYVPRGWNDMVEHSEDPTKPSKANLSEMLKEVS